GQMALDPHRARRAVTDHIARPLGLDATQAAWAIHRIVNENMANAAHVHLIERGADRHAYALFAFGGAGPVHAYGVASLLAGPSVIVPPSAGVASAVGFLTAPPAFEFVRGWYSRLGEVDWARVNEVLDGMEAQGRAVIAGAAHGLLDTPVFDRYRLAPSVTVEGPAIIEERESTIVIGPGGQAWVDESLNVVVDLPVPPGDGQPQARGGASR